MTKQVQRRRGTATQHTSFTGAEGELSVNTTNKSVHVHDNVTAGGFEAARADMDNVTSSSILTAAGITATSTELNYVDGVTSNIQTQLDGKAGTASPTFTGTLTTANLTATGTTTLAGASTSADITFGDNDKAIFGAGSDLQIYHDGSASYIDDAGTGALYIRGNAIVLEKYTGERLLDGTGDAAVKLYHDNAIKLTTTSTGVDITGTLTSDGLTVDGDANLSGTAVNFDLDETDTTDLNTRFRQSAGQLFVQTINDEKSVGSNRININHTTGDISFYEDTGTTAKFFWDASAESLGIGTTSPSDKLEVLDGALMLKSSSASGYPNLKFENGSQRYDVQIDGATQAFRIVDNTASAERMRIDSSGNVGIGVIPETWLSTIDALQVGLGASFAGNTTNPSRVYLSANYYINSSNQESYIATDEASQYFQNAGTHIFKVAPSGTADSAISWTTAMTVDNSGNVGIGTSSPVTKLTIEAASDHLRLQGTANTNNNVSILYNESGDYGQINCDESGVNQKDLWITGLNLLFGRNTSTEAMRIDSSGKVIIGTEPDNTYSQGWSSIDGTQDSSKDSTASRTHYTFRNPNGSVGTIQTSGSSTSYNTSSDYRLKTDAQPMTGATDRLKQLNPVNFEWIADGTRVDGFLAHEAQAVVPEAVTGAKDAMRDEEYEVTPAVLDDDGNVVTEAVMGTRSVPDYQGIDQSKLVPLLVATIKELEARITALENA